MINENIIVDLSSEFTENKVYLCDSEEFGKTIKKIYKFKAGFYREVEAMNNVHEQLRPDIYYISEQEQVIYSSYNPMKVFPKDPITTLVALTKKLHESSSKIGRVIDPGERYTVDNWMEYLVKRGENWLIELNKYRNYNKIFYSQIEYLSKIYSQTLDSRVCIIHRDIRMDNVGEKDGKYILFDYELAMWGDRYWDIARLIFDNMEHFDFICAEYGLTNKEFIKSYVKLFAMSFADFLIRSSIPQKRALEKCINTIEDF